MKKYLLLIISILVSSLAHTQNYVVEYDHVISFPTNSTEAVYRLECQRNKSVYYQLRNNFIEKTDNEVIRINKGVVFFVIKDFLNKKTFYNQPIINRIKFITDKLPMQVWTLKNETKKIKSFTCKKATTSFRGRNYTAWYTEELSIIGGPWKFDGLPGLILSVSSDDKVVKIEATKIEKKANLELTKFEVEEEKLITWEDYCTEYRKIIERIEKNMKADSELVESEIDVKLVEDIGL